MMAPLPNSTTSLVATLNAGIAWPITSAITFSIPTAGSSWARYAAGDEPFLPGYAIANASVAAQIRLAMQGWDELIAPALMEVIEPTTQGNIRLAFTDMAGPWGYASLRWQASTLLNADIWIDTDHRLESFGAQTYNFQALQHEIGHALGLKHPFESPNLLPAAIDTHRTTLMSYTEVQDRYVYSFAVTQTSPTSSSIRATPTPVVIAGPQLLDVLAIQAIYGADPTTRAGDTSYTFDPAIASIRTIYDAGGIDTWDLSGSARPSLIDLREGAFSSVNQYSVAAQIEASLASVGETWRGFVTSVLSGDSTFTWENNVSIAYGTIIENLRLGSASDQVIGNAARNALHGNGGNDSLRGEDGDDSLVGGAGDDTLAGGLGVDRFEVDAGTDTIADLGLGGPDVLVVAAGAIANATLGEAWIAPAAAGNAGTVNITGAGFGVTLSSLALSGGVWNVSNAGHARGVLFQGSANAEQLTGGEGRDTLVGGAGHDSLSGHGDRDSLLGGPGNDNLAGGEGHDTLLGEADQDVLTGGTGNDSLSGGAGNDTLLGEADNDLLSGGLGDDRMTGGLGMDRFGVDGGTDTITDLGLGGADLLVISAGATANATLANHWILTAGNNNSGTANITAAGFSVDLARAAGNGGWTVSNLGTARAASLTGSARHDTITGGLGPDTLRGGGGNDRLLGDAGNDRLIGGAGDDTKTGGAGVDRFEVDAGYDSITDLGFGGNDLLVVSAGAVARVSLGANWIASNNVVNNGQVVIYPAEFNLNLSAATGNGLWVVGTGSTGYHPTIIGSAQRDWLLTGEGWDSLVGNAGDDTLVAHGGNDTLIGGAGVDSLVGGHGDDRLTGGQGVDRFLVETDTDTITDLGFGGTDALIIQAGATARATIGGHWTASAGSSNAGSAILAAAGFNVDLASVGGSSGWVLTNAHARGVRLVGSDQADTIRGGTGADTIRGQAGADSLSGGDGNDQLLGGAGNDTMTGGAGIDRFTVDAGVDVITDFGAAGVDILNISAGATALVTMRADWVATDASSNLGVANLVAAGFDVNLQAVRGTAGWNVSNAGDANAVRLTGTIRSDTLTGGDGDDWLNPLGAAGGGNEVLDGGAGADTLLGTGGSRLTGGSGADLFVFSSVGAMQNSMITDFNAAEGDRLDLRGVDADLWEEERQLTFIGSDSFTRVEVIDGEEFTFYLSGAMRFENGWLQFDVNRDGVADRQMQLLGVTTLNAEDMWL